MKYGQVDIKKLLGRASGVVERFTCCGCKRSQPQQLPHPAGTEKRIPEFQGLKFWENHDTVEKQVIEIMNFHCCPLRQKLIGGLWESNRVTSLFGDSDIQMMCRPILFSLQA